MQEGVIVKGIGGFYYVELPNEKIIECRARGKFRKENIIPLVGDKVVIEMSGMDTGYIIEIKERKSKLIRPAIANVDQVLVVFAVKEPDINFALLDRILVQIEDSNLEAILCLNKTDLAKNEDFEFISNIYSNAGYRVIKTNALEKEGVDELKGLLKNKITVFAGPSGVGKSTLFNYLQDKVKMQTGDISFKISRGKHTTRHAQLIKIEEDSYLVDTPGFSTLDIEYIDEDKLQFCFREFKKYIGQCKFTSCLHYKEKDCAIIEKVKEGLISSTRYNNYIEFLTEIKNSRRINK